MAGDDEQLWDRRFAEKEWISTPDPLLVELVGPLPPGRALDVASGPGRNSLWLAGSGWEVTALDSSVVALRQAVAGAAAAGLRLQTVQADVVTWRPPATAYDLVVVANLHLPTVDLTSLLTRLGEVLRPGGHLFVVGHDVANLGRHGPPDATLLLTVERLAAALPSGLVVERLGRLLRPVLAPGDANSDWAVLAWARRPDDRLDIRGPRHQPVPRAS